jgi:hypothetical protein
LSAFLPARKASQVHPVDIIRGASRQIFLCKRLVSWGIDLTVEKGESLAITDPSEVAQIALAHS